MELLRAPAPPHRIQTLRFEIDGPDEAVLLQLRARIDEICERALPDALSDMLDNLADENEILEIRRLDIELGNLADTELDLPAITGAIQRALRNLPPSRGATASAPRHDPSTAGEVSAESGPAPSRRPIGALRLEQFSSYLLHGDFGSNDPATRLQDLIADLQSPESALEEIVNVLQAAPAARRRAGIMRLLAAAPDALLAALAARLRRSQGSTGSAVLLRSAAELRTRAEAVETALFPATASQPGSAAPEREATQTAAATNDETRPLIQAPNAGVVMLHAFLPQLFDRLHLLRHAQFRDEAARIIGVRLVHYLASGETAAEEPVLVAPRLLCGLGADTPVLEQAALDTAHTTLAENLIDSAIELWPKLGNTSAAAMRETFLSRPGVLKGHPERPLLIVESRGVDVLLGSMPWALTPVRLPWLQRPLPVHWQ